MSSILLDVLELCDSNVLAQKAKTEKQLVNLQNFDELDDDNFLQSDEESSISNNSSTGFNSENDKGDNQFYLECVTYTFIFLMITIS